MKTVGGLRKTRHRGRGLVEWFFVLAAAAYNFCEHGDENDAVTFAHQMGCGVLVTDHPAPIECLRRRPHWHTALTPGQRRAALGVRIALSRTHCLSLAEKLGSRCVPFIGNDSPAA